MAIADLETALRDLAESLAVPVPAADAVALDPARRARLRIEREVVGPPARPGRLAGLRIGWIAPAPSRRIGRVLVPALVAVVLVAAIAGAIGLGLPGIRIITAPSGSAGPATTATAAGSSGLPSPQPTTQPAAASGPPGSGLQLGDPIAVAEAVAGADFPVRLPAAPGVGSPATAWLLDGRLSFVWRTGEALPATDEPGVGMILSEFRGSVDPGYFQKILSSGTTISTVSVDGVTGYWISGAPHEIVFVDANGRPVFDRRSVGDTLLWARGDVTYRLEAGLDRAAAISLAATLR